MSGINGVVEKDNNKAFECFLKGADQGDVQSQCNLGIIHYYHYSSLLFINGIRLGVLLLKGVGCSKDEKRAFEMFKMSAEHNSTDAEFNIGTSFFILFLSSLLLPFSFFPSYSLLLFLLVLILIIIKKRIYYGLELDV